MRRYAFWLHFAFALSVFSSFSCDKKKLSTDHDEGLLVCGSDVGSKYFKVPSDDGSSTLDGNSFKVIIRKKTVVYKRLLLRKKGV